jgi:hypothetical protein
MFTLPLSPQGDTDPMTWRAAVYALTTPGILPHTYASYGTEAQTLLELAHLAGSTATYVPGWRITARAEVAWSCLDATYVLNFTPWE